MKELNFKKRAVFPDAGGAFFFKLKSIDEIKGGCLVVVDTNALIVPFTSGNKSIEAIRDLYKKLSDENRLFVPVHVVREFLDNRANKLSSLHNALSDKSSQSFKELDDHPLLKELGEFEEVKKAEREIVEAFKKYRKAIGETKKVIRGWGWNDPVSKMYHEVLDGRILEDIDFDRDKILEDAKRRETLSIPPGYKDSSKEDNKVGDLLIWNEILGLAKREEKDLIFVTHEEKADWWHKSSGGPLYTRMELVDEYRRASRGRSFHIKNLSEVLSIFGADRDAVEEVEKSEAERVKRAASAKMDGRRIEKERLSSEYNGMREQLLMSDQRLESSKSEFMDLMSHGNMLRNNLMSLREKMHEDSVAGKVPEFPPDLSFYNSILDEIKVNDERLNTLKQRIEAEKYSNEEIQERLESLRLRSGLAGITF